MSGNKSVNNDVDRGKGGDSNCYFCNASFEMGQLQIHLKQCGSILEQCPLRCGAWIQRKHKDTHVLECPKMEKKQSTSPTHVRVADPSPPASLAPIAPANHTWSPAAVSLESCVNYLEKEVSNIKMILTEDASHRDVQATELDNIRSKLILLEERGQHFLNVLSSLRSLVDDETDRTANWTAQFKHDIDNVQLALQELQSQQLSTVMRLESTVSSLVHEQHERELLESAVAQQDRQIRGIGQMHEAIEYIKSVVEEERAQNAENRAALEAELSEARRSSEQLHQLEALRVQMQNEASDRPAMDRLAVLELSTAEARTETSEQAARLDLFSRDLRALTKSYAKLRNELADFQSRVSFNSSELGCEDGHLIWRIDNVSTRMKEAKENDTVIVSPIFRTSKYGYTLKAELNLNGIGKWKGRNITCCVRTVAGQWDALLEWPCELAVNIALKDQAKNRHQAMDIIKSLNVRRESSSKRHDFDNATEVKTENKTNSASDKSVLQMKRQYIFIPHSSLDKFDYIKEDTMFFEIIVKL